EGVKIMNTAHWRRAPLGAACCAALAALTLAAAGATAATAGTKAAASRSGAAPIVATGNGAVRGTTAGGIHEFLGIPYAAPPTGHLRWRPPKPPADWRGVRDATQFGPSCPQPPSPFLPPAHSARTACTSTCIRRRCPAVTCTTVTKTADRYLCGS